jgi:hypothetical protein
VEFLLVKSQTIVILWEINRKKLSFWKAWFKGS